MTDREYDQMIEELGNLRERVRQLEENEYVTATYKCYSSEGLTLSEVIEEIETTNQAIEVLKARLDEDTDADN
ncbi:MAG: hypothetical protein L0G32_04465 [Pediococcus sp.]|nr:hypothetical protein [Pediococcus sp.]